MKVTINNLVENWDKVKPYLNSKTHDTYNTGFEDLLSMQDDPEIKQMLDDFINDVNRQLKDVELDEPKKTEEPAKKEQKKEPKEKKTKQPKAKFKVGQKVVTDHSSNVYTIVEINEKGQYKLDTTSGWWAENQLSKPKKQPKPKKEPKAKKEKQPKPKFKVGAYVKVAGDYGVVLASEFEDGAYKYRIGKKIVFNDAPDSWIEERALAKSSKKEYDKAQKDFTESKKTPVASFPLEYSLLKRHLSLHGKTISQARKLTQNNPEAILRAIQKAIEEKKIRKDSKYADEIMTAQKQLIKIIRAYSAKKIDGSTPIEIENYEGIKKIVDSMRIDDVAKISSNFISKVQEKENKKKEAENILAKLNELKADADNKEVVSAMKKAIKDYMDGKTEKVEAVERQLRGLLGSISKKNNGCRGLGSIAGDITADSTITADQLLKANFDTLPFTGRWEAFFGRPSRNFKCMIYGRAGSGKSTFAIQFAKYLSAERGMKVLYIASEEKFGHTLQEKVRRFNVANPNISFADRLPLDITKYDVVFFDSVNDMQIEPKELMDMTANIAMVGIFQCTKAGTFRGGEDFAHDMDIVVNVDDMVAVTEKNRFKSGSMEFAVR